MIVILMGVCGCGKTRIGELLAKRLRVPFHDGDGFHPPENVEKMRSGEPLTDGDRRPWLERLNTEMKIWNRGHEQKMGAVLACSALRKAYRDLLRMDFGSQAIFVHLHGSPEILAERMRARRGHYMPATLLESQLAILESPKEDEGALIVEIDATPDEVAQKICDALKGKE